MKWPWNKPTTEGPAVEFVAEVGKPQIGLNTVYFIVEGVARRAEHFQKTFKLDQPVVVDGLTAQFCYSALGSPVGDIAIVLHVTSGENMLAAFNVRGHSRYPMIVPYQTSWPGGISIDKLTFAIFDDMGHPTNFRLTLIFHRK